MSAFDAPRPIASGPALADTSPVSQGRLVRVELRKLMDTRAGTWLLLGDRPAHRRGRGDLHVRR